MNEENRMDEPVRQRRAAGWYPDPSGRYKHAYWDGSDWRPDVTAALNRINKNLFIRRGALARIGEFLLKDETVERIATGTYYSWGNRSGVLVLTDRRLLLLIGGRRTVEVRDYPLESVSSAEAGWGGIAVFVNGKTLRLTTMNGEDADEFAYALRRHVGHSATEVPSWKRWLPPQWRL
jgi:hypothetical protein